MDFLEVFAARLKKERELKNITQADLAKLISISRTSLSSYELATALPNIETVVKLAEFFNVTTDYLTGRSDFKTFEEESFYKSLNLKNTHEELQEDFKSHVKETITVLLEFLKEQQEPRAAIIIAEIIKEIEFVANSISWQNVLEAQKILFEKGLLNIEKDETDINANAIDEEIKSRRIKQNERKREIYRLIDELIELNTTAEKSVTEKGIGALLVNVFNTAKNTVNLREKYNE